MLIGFDRQAFAIQQYGGISRYFTDLYLGLNEHLGVEAQILFSKHQNEYLLEQGKGEKLSSFAAKAYVKFLEKSNLSIPISSRVDIHHSTFYLGRPRRGGRGGRLVSTLYDMIPELLPNYFKVNPHVNKLCWLRDSDLIISISEAAAHDLAYFRPELANRIRCIHLYSGFSNQSLQSKPSAFEPSHGAYMLFVGQRGGYKNASLLLRAFAASDPMRDGLRLLFAGGGPFSLVEQAELARLGLTGAVKQISVNDAELWYLYRHAAAVLIPSLAEGFSLPLVEGLAADIPVISSDIAVHREVAACFSSQINALNYQDWADIIASWSSLKKPSEILGADAYEQRLSYFSKMRMVEEHVTAYADLLA
jgi:glycosyltransferase involved in cell wall biosynthesis